MYSFDQNPLNEYLIYSDINIKRLINIINGINIMLKSDSTIFWVYHAQNQIMCHVSGKALETNTRPDPIKYYICLIDMILTILSRSSSLLASGTPTCPVPLASL